MLLLPIKKNAFIFDIVHTNVWGPALTVSLFVFKYFVTFVDDFSHVTWVYLWKSKSDVLSIFTSFHKMVEIQFERRIKILRMDNGR